MRKLFTYFTILLLLFTTYPVDLALSQPQTIIEDETTEVVLFAEDIDEEIELYETLDSIIEEEPSLLIPDDTVVEILDHPEYDESIEEELLSILDEYVFIQYIEEDEADTELEEIDLTIEQHIDDEVFSDSTDLDQSLSEVPLTNQELINEDGDIDDDFIEVEDNVYEGFVHEDYVVSIDEADNYRESRLNKQEEGGTEETIEEDDELDEIEEETSPITTFSTPAITSVSMTGLALKQPVHVYESEDRNSKILKSYDYGHQLKFRTHTDDWHRATVYISGKPHSGYIHTSDVGESKEASAVYGVALKNSTNVYSSRNRNNVLRSYKKGHILKYKAHSKDWFSATVRVNGKWQSGFIHRRDVETGVSSPKTLQGVGINSPTSVYQRATTSSKALKSYNYGSILKFKEFTSDWYEATVYIKGKPNTGYIRKTHVGSMDTSLSGFAQKNPTHVYSKRSKSSTSLKSYKIGSTLKYRPYNKDWYRATVRVNGKWQSGFIHANDVGAKAPQISGYAQKNPTVVYSKRSKSSNALKSYPKGAKLKYRYYNKNWYSATVINNGKREHGYIHANDVGSKEPILYGYAHKSPTYVYATNSKKSKKLKSYRKGSRLKYRYYNRNWYIATVRVNGKWQTGYIHASDVGFSKQTNIVNPKKTYKYSHMISDISKLQEMYPDLIQYKIVGQSEYGRNIYAVGLGKGKATTFINGSLHAREWITTSLNMYMIENYAKAYRNNSSIQGYKARSILNNTTIWFMPMVNPDGVTLQQDGLKSFPKNDHSKIIRYNNGSRNFKRWKANAKGVDINRNFSVHWSTQNSPASPSHMNHRGPRAHSEKETQAVVNFVSEIRPRMTINYHSSGEVIYWKYRQSRANMNRDYKYARQISNFTGYGLMEANNGRKKAISGGGFLQYFTSTYNLPSITPELGKYAGNTNVSPSNFNRIWDQNKAVGLYAAQESYKLYRK